MIIDAETGFFYLWFMKDKYGYYGLKWKQKPSSVLKIKIFLSSL